MRYMVPYNSCVRSPSSAKRRVDLNVQGSMIRGLKLDFDCD